MEILTIITQICMGLSLAACAGLRAWLPLLIVSILAKTGYVHLTDSFQFLARTDSLIVFGVATVIEILGDKIVAVDHFLDAIGTVIRPAAGAVLASAMLTEIDPLAGLVGGIIIGGSTAFVVHAGKLAARAKMTLLAPVHGGLGNFAASLFEDFVSLLSLAGAILLPIVAAVGTVALLALAVFFVRMLIRSGQKWFGRKDTNVAGPPNVT